MDTLLIDNATRRLFEAFSKTPPQSLLLVGPAGIGKMTLATAWSQTVTEHPTDTHIISPDERGTIGIEVIRDLYRTSRAKQDSRQVVIIEQAHNMSTEAQNAFLKLLEEPRPGLTFVLTALRIESLLPTIISRIQQVTLKPLDDDTIRRAIMAKKPGIAEAELAQLVFLSQGRPGVALQLLTEGTLSLQRDRMQLVKKLLTAQPYERFVLISTLANDRQSCIASLEAMMRIVEVQLTSAKNRAQLEHWLALVNALEDTLQSISNNGNLRAQLLYLFSRY